MRRRIFLLPSPPASPLERASGPTPTLSISLTSPSLSLFSVFTLSKKQSDYILDAGLAAGLELPFTCRAGICGACVGRVAAGAVDMSDVS